VAAVSGSLLGPPDAFAPTVRDVGSVGGVGEVAGVGVGVGRGFFRETAQGRRACSLTASKAAATHRSIWISIRQIIKI
jgi:hypothetical protein